MTHWTLEPTSAVSRGVATVAYLAAILLFGLLQEVGLRLRREEHRAWWAGTGRDLANAAGFAVLAGTLRLFGFPAPAAILVGGTLTLYLLGSHTFWTTQTRARRSRLWALLVGLAGALPVLLFPAEVLAFFGEAVASFFPLLGGAVPRRQTGAATQVCRSRGPRNRLLAGSPAAAGGRLRRLCRRRGAARPLAIEASAARSGTLGRGT